MSGFFNAIQSFGQMFNSSQLMGGLGALSNIAAVVGRANQQNLQARQQANQIRMQAAQAQSQAQAAQAQAQAYRVNAEIARANAARAIEAGEEAKSRRERIAKANLAETATKFLKGGVTFSGSPLAILGEQAANEQVEAEDLLYSKRIDAANYINESNLQDYYGKLSESKASSYEANANTYLSDANFVEESGSANPFETLLTAGLSGARGYTDYQRSRSPLIIN